MKWSIKIKAGSLQFVLFIGVVIALLLVTFVTLAQTNSLFGKKTELLIDTVQRADMGLSIAFKKSMPANDSILLETLIDDQIALKGIREYWGIFEKYTVVATSKKNRFVKSVLAGTKNSNGLPALYLKDNQRPLIIVGNSKITGDAFLPEQGIRPGNIAGNSFYGSAPVIGQQRQSRSQLPKLPSELEQHLDVITRGGIQQNSFEVLRFSRGLIARNSFKEKTQIINGSILDLTNVSLSGNIVVNANQRIVVSASSQLQDVLLIAPEIRIEKGVKGTFQALASKHIEVGSGCQLGYPSALVVKNRTVSTKNSTTIQKPNIFIGSKSEVKGVLVYIENTNASDSGQQKFHPQIKLDTDSSLWGELYCEGNLEHKGSIIGGANTHGFMALEGGSIYQNHLYNGTINSLELPPEYAGLPLERQENHKAIAKWLY